VRCLDVRCSAACCALFFRSLAVFITDRDLLVLEPNLFRDVGWAGQRLLSATGSVSGTTLTVPGADFVALGVDAGHVAVLGANYEAVEVVQRLSATSLQVSRPRADAAGAAIAPSAGTGLAVVIGTFRPQIAIVHRQVLRMLGLGEAGSALGGEAGLDESAVTNPGELALLEAAGTLHLVLGSAGAVGAVGGAGGAMARRAEHYREVFAAERGRTAARVDTNGDGVAEVTRYLNVVQLGRG
jgi:hypothetical protein